MLPNTDNNSQNNKEEIVPSRSFTPYAPVSKWELWPGVLYFMSCLLYGIYNIGQVSSAVRNNSSLTFSYFLAEGQFVSKCKDASDSEWNSFQVLIWTYIPFLLLNACLTWTLNAGGLLHLRKWTSLIIGAACLIKIIGLNNTFLIYSRGLLAYLLMYFLNPILVAWLLSIAVIYFHLPFDMGEPWAILHARSYAYWHLGWNTTRLISFAHEWHRQRQKKTKEQKSEKADNNQNMTFTFFDFLAYCCYAPTLFGSIFSYVDFYRQVICSNQDSGQLAGKRVQFLFCWRYFLSKLLEVTAWAIGIVIALEVVYINIMKNDLDLVKMMNGFGASAFTWAHGQYFQAKYMTIYGLPLLAAYLDGGVRLFPLPIFISRVYLYSNMWKYFDTGLYDFMKRYIYVPLGGSANYLVSATVTFAFIYVWHGLTYSIAVWTILNFAQVVGEALVRKWAAKKDSLLFRLNNYLSPSNWRRLKALTCALSAQSSAVAISFFLMGEKCGMLISEWAILRPMTINYAIHITCAYVWVQTCFSWENWMAGYPL